MTTILYMAPRNAHMASSIKFCDHFRILRLSWTANSLKSEGLEQFVDEFLPIIRENNPQIRYYLNRTYVECDPFVVGEYVWSRFRSRRVCWKSKHQILAAVEEMSLGGTFHNSKRARVTDRLPRGFEVQSSETLGHDVYKVLSKWKGDPVDPTEFTVQTHPNYTYIRYGVKASRLKKEQADE
uniref:Ribosomal protein/NADH dehydrogenase domain-containing protein n=1 Tax=Acrobeloides nanus TaxID=290746 RepID=A0A914DZT7_9BILA